MPAFCKICFDSGKDSSMYQSHYVRAGKRSSSPVICPTLLSITCRKCGEKGHTFSYCNNDDSKTQQLKEILHFSDEKCIPVGKKNTEILKQVLRIDTNLPFKDDDDYYNTLPKISRRPSTEWSEQNQWSPTFSSNL